MTDTEKLTTPEQTTEPTSPVVTNTPPAVVVAGAPVSPRRGGRGGGNQRRGGFRRGGRGRDGNEEQDEFEQKTIDLARVTRVVKGGKRMRFRATVAVGNRQGQVAVGMGKGQDVATAMNKAVTKAKKLLVTVPIIRQTIPFELRCKFKASIVLLKPAVAGRGIIAGGAVRTVLELAGIPNVVAKMVGGGNKVSNVQATMVALRELEQWGRRNGKISSTASLAAPTAGTKRPGGRMARPGRAKAHTTA